jgi:hypothetical protein
MLFWTHLIEPLVDVGQVESHFSPFGGSFVLVQDRCTVCAKHSIGSEIIFWTHLQVLLGDKAQLDARFSLFGDIANSS